MTRCRVGDSTMGVLTASLIFTLLLGGLPSESSDTSRTKRYDLAYNFDPYGPQSNPCHHYVRLRQPERRVGNKINALTDSALCDRAIHRRWYRFESEAGGVMPDKCVEEFSCGTHAPIWFNGKHPKTYGEVEDVEVCLSLAGHCCRRRWYIRAANCGHFYTYLLTDTPGCFMAYCVGNELPCPEGQSSPTGFSPGCSELFPVLEGNATIHLGQEGKEIVFYCDYEGPIASSTMLVVDWFVHGENSGVGDEGEYLIWQDMMEERRRSKLTEGRWMGKMGSSIFCHIRGKFINGTGAPSPVLKSEKYFAGIKIKQRVVNVSESGDDTEIEVQSTVPIGCLPQFEEACKLSLQVAHDSQYQAKRCIDGKVRQVVFGDCSVDIPADNWKEPRTVKVKAVRDFYNDGNKRMVINFKPAYSTMLSPIWNNYKLPEVEVLAQDAPTRICQSTGDPHYSTFDGVYYHVYLEGEFVMYKNTRLPIQINTRLERCGESVSCNCAVAVKAADDVIVIDRCLRRRRNLAYGESFPEGWRTLHRHALEQGGDFTEGLKIYEYDGGRRFTVHLPTGAYLEFRIGQGDKWINVYIHASSDDWLSTLGLCGTFDGNRDNDFTFPDRFTKTTPRDNEACGDSADVCKFAEAWRVQEKDSFFGELVNVPLEEHKFTKEHQYCKCERDGEESTVVCNYQYDVDNCQARQEQVKGEDRTPDLLSRSRSRSKRSADNMDEDDDYFNSAFIYDESFRGKEPRFPTPSGITHNVAREYCINLVLESPVGRLCNNLVRNQYSNLVDSCITDIKVTDDFSWGQSSLTTLSEECADAIHVDAKMWGVDPNDPGPTPTPASEVIVEFGINLTSTTTTTTTAATTPLAVLPQAMNLLRQLCPSDCSNHGWCQDGTCVCQRGYAGTDCSQDILVNPKAFHLSNGGLCDVTKKACKQVRVYGTHFRKSPGLKCTIQPIQLKDNTYSKFGDPIETEATYDTFEEVLCRLPNDDVTTSLRKAQGGATYHAMLITVANDLLHKTKPLLHIVYDPGCRSCTNQATNSSCTKVENSCEVDGRCYVSGERHQEDCCMTCQPEVSTQELTNNAAATAPMLLPVQTMFEVSVGQTWSIMVRSRNKGGCDVTLAASTTSPSHLASEQVLEGVMIKLIDSSKVGQFTMKVVGTSECGAETQINYHVIVMPADMAATPAPDHPDCEDNFPPTFLDNYDNEQLSLDGYAGQLIEMTLVAVDPDNHTLEYFYVKDKDRQMHLSDEGVLKYRMPDNLTQDTLTIISQDACGATASLMVEIIIKPCPCRNGGRCQPHPTDATDYHCDCTPGYGGRNCHRVTENDVTV